MVKNIVAILAFLAVFLFAATGPVPYYGSLSTSGKYIVGSNFGDSKPVQVRGISLYWSCPSWEKDTDKFWSAASVDALVDVFKVDIVRAAMAANNAAGCGGDYQNNKTASLNRVKAVVNQAIARDIYVIIDWHSHTAHNQQQQVIDFFVTDMKEYHNIPNVIFEIFNEPQAIQWTTTIKPFADAVTKAIRNAGANNLVLVGTRNWAQYVNECGETPVADNNFACVQHFYAGSHKLNANMGGATTPTFKGAAETTLNRGIPVFVSEYGTVNSDGAGAVSTASADEWHAFMDQNKISSCIWSFSSLGEGSAIYKDSFTPPSSGSDASWSNEGNMSDNGKYILNKLKGYAQTAEWRNAPPPPSSSSETPSSSSSTPSSSSNGIIAPIALSKIPGLNGAQIISNGVALQVLNNAALEIFGLDGKSVRKLSFASGSWQVQFADLPKGLYIVKVSFGNNMEVLRVPVK
ncbi:MAG: cellulase family glycosylhydrolase [Fibromonadales bacterium]|nr:cellulase family glycosylhydrolase [Fibromonadales bacterium]